MGFFSNLFGNRQSNDHTAQFRQPEGFYIVSYDYGENQARALFQRANAGDINAQMTLAKCFKTACEPSYALPWYEKAAVAGNSQALHELTYFYEGRYVGIEANPEKAKWAREQAMKMNNPNAFVKLASQYYMGDGVEMDKAKAFQYYMKAAELGNDEGMAEVGLCYLNGEGVEKNDIQAFRWLSRSKDGFYGYYNLAQCYLHGIGTAKDIEKAVVYLEKAVDCKCANLWQARNQLVDLYSKGYGGDNAIGKLKKVQKDIGKNDRLLKDLMDLEHS